MQVYAKGKGGGRGAIRQSAGVPGVPGGIGAPGGMQMVKPPVPEVDPENAEFVVFMRAKNYPGEKGVLIKEGKWIPLSVFKGSGTANYLVKALETGWGRALYSNLVIRNIATGLYNDREKIELGVRRGYPPFKDVPSKNFSWGFKVRDKTKPEDWTNSDGLTELPSQEQVMTSPLDAAKAFFGMDNVSKMFATQ